MRVLDCVNPIITQRSTDQADGCQHERQLLHHDNE